MVVQCDVMFDASNTHGVKVLESVVALIDPDFIFLKPLTTWISPTETVVRGDGLSIEGLKLENGGWIRAGYPAGESTMQ